MKAFNAQVAPVIKSSHVSLNSVTPSMYAQPSIQYLHKRLSVPLSLPMRDGGKTGTIVEEQTFNVVREAPCARRRWALLSSLRTAYRRPMLLALVVKIRLLIMSRLPSSSTTAAAASLSAAGPAHRHAAVGARLPAHRDTPKRLSRRLVMRRSTRAAAL